MTAKQLISVLEKDYEQYYRIALTEDETESAWIVNYKLMLNKMNKILRLEKAMKELNQIHESHVDFVEIIRTVLDEQ